MLCPKKMMENNAKFQHFPAFYFLAEGSACRGFSPFSITQNCISSGWKFLFHRHLVVPCKNCWLCRTPSHVAAAELHEGPFENATSTGHETHGALKLILCSWACNGGVGTGKWAFQSQHSGTQLCLLQPLTILCYMGLIAQWIWGFLWVQEGS